MKIKKVEKLVATSHDKIDYVIHIRNLKQPLNHGLLLKKVHRVIKFNHNVCLKPCINIKTDLRKNKNVIGLIRGELGGKKLQNLLD